MDVGVSVFICFFSALKVCSAAAPDVCFQQFKWEDCGMPPKAVIYYYKSGSRCEVGLWRGCLPNPNMFVDEYECVQTCIFSVRARPDDYHKFQDNIIMESEETTTTVEPTVADNNGTTVSGTGATGGEAEGEEGEKGGEGGGEGGVTGGGEAPAEGGGEAPAEGGGEAPAEGGGEAPAEGGGEAPAEGGGEAPAEGGGEAPAEGGDEAPAEGEGGGGRKQGGKN